MIITGLRGVGKTVLLNRFRQPALGQDWVVVEMELSKRDNCIFRGSECSEQTGNSRIFTGRKAE
ncbi:hypothetical protein [uncultured Corynebacterium sp.]|uniref:hypothetical protein n=1 Tax=uncultured Corynebacterium sp. TaxID=159447 RepID=UPI0025FB4EBE|nr:hypothetical protein [uncultured Corynebacterium sp.]